MSEIEMHYGEALEWILALEEYIRFQGLEVPTWADVELFRANNSVPVLPATHLEAE